MKRNGFSVWVAAAVAVTVALVLLSAPPSGAEETAVEPVRVGIVSSLFQGVPASFIPGVLKPVQSMMESQTGLSGKVVPIEGWEQLSQELDAGKTQIGLFHGFEFAWAKQKYPRLRALVVTVGRKGLSHACLVVRSDSTARKVEDLKGTTLALPRKTREHCRLYLRHRCAGCDCTPDAFFKTISQPHYTEEGLGAVVRGRAQAVLIDGAALEAYRENQPENFAQLKVLAKSEPFPPAVFVCREGVLDATTQDRFRKGMLVAHESERGQNIMSICQIIRFDRVPDDYDAALTAVVKSYPPPAASPSK